MTMATSRTKWWRTLFGIGRLAEANDEHRPPQQPAEQTGCITHGPEVRAGGHAASIPLGLGH